MAPAVITELSKASSASPLLLNSRGELLLLIGLWGISLVDNKLSLFKNPLTSELQ